MRFQEDTEVILANTSKTTYLQQVMTNATRPDSLETPLLSPVCSSAAVISLLCVTPHVVSTLTQTSSQTSALTGERPVDTLNTDESVPLFYIGLVIHPLDISLPFRR